MKSKVLAKIWILFLVIVGIGVTILDTIYGDAEILTVLLFTGVLLLLGSITVWAVVELMDRDE